MVFTQQHIYEHKLSPCAETVSHHSAVGSGPFSSPHHPERAVPEPLEQLQLRLSDQARE